MPTQTLKSRLDVLIPQIRRHSQRSNLTRGSHTFFLGLCGFSLAVGLGVCLGTNARRLVAEFLKRETAEFKFDVFLNDHADRSFLEERFLSTPGVRFVRFVTKQEALGRAQDNPALVESLKLAVRNPLPESFDVDWNPAFLTSAPWVTSTAEKWGALDGVAQVGFDRSRLERLALLSRVARQTDVVASVLLWAVVGAVAVAIGTLLFGGPGARWSFFLWAGGWGAVGGGGAAAVVWGWLGVWEPAGLLAGALVGFLGGFTRGHPDG